MEVRIRKASINDFEDLCVIYKELDEYHRIHHPELFIKPEGFARDKDYIENIINDDKKAIFVAEAESKVAGFAECYILKSPSFPILRKREWVQLDSIAVKREYQNSKIGTMLLEKVFEWAKEKGINRIELKVYSFNENALKFYSDKGFKELNRTMYMNI